MKKTTEGNIIQLPSGPVIEMVYVQGGEFMMGDDKSRNEDEKPCHPVRISDFSLGKFPVTQDVWRAVMGDNPSYFKGERRPVENVSWNETQDFIRLLNQQTGITFRLPTEAEWEYAARGGRHSQGYKYAGSDLLEQVGWHYENSIYETHEVGQLHDNELGLFDMNGNVREWCHDRYSRVYYKECSQHGVVNDPQGPMDKYLRVVRGGSFLDSRVNCNFHIRYGGFVIDMNVEIGFRLAMSC